FADWPNSQGNRTSELGEEAGKVVVLPSGEFELAPQGGLGVVLAHDIESQMAQDGEIVGAVVQAVAGLIFIHDDVEAPVQPVLDAPMRAYDSVAARGGQGGAEQVIGGLGRGFGGEFAGSDVLAMAASPGHRCCSCSQAISVQTTAVRVSIRPWSPSTVVSVVVVADAPASCGSSRNRLTSACRVPWLPLRASA